MIRKSHISLRSFLFLILLISVQSVFCQIINIEERRNLNLDTIQWHEQLHLGVNFIQNKESVLSINGGAQLEFVFNNKMLLSVTSAAFVKAGDREFVNEGYQHLRYNSKINNWLIYELFGQVQYNDQAFIKIRALAGSGLRIIALKKEKRQIFVGLSYMFEYDEETNNEIVHQDSRANSYLSFQLALASNVSLSGTTYFQPLFKRFDDYRLTINTSLNFQVTKKLGLSTSYRYLFDSRRPEGAPRRIYSLNNMIRYNF